MKTKNFHYPVLLQETLTGLKVKKGGVYIDATLGHAGHTIEILNLGGIIYAIDQDKDSIKTSKKRLEACPPSVVKHHRRSQDAFTFIQANFKDLEKIVKDNKIPSPDGILFDLGLNTSQITGQGKGFSFADQESLDMRLDPHSELPSAKDIVNTYSLEEIDHILSSLAQETNSKRIATIIIKNRPFQSASQLAQIIQEKLPRTGRTHPATKTFLALKIYVNQEIKNLKSAFWQSIDLLKPGKRLCFITFHSGEDRLIKLEGQSAVSKNLLKTIKPYPTKPTREEIQKNPLSRSALLRIFEKI